MGEPNKTRHLSELLESFDTAMLLTRVGDQIHARPMAIAEVEGASTMWFVTSSESPKAQELRTDFRVSLTMQSAHKFVAISGTSALVQDRARIEALWKDTWKVWFPEGKKDPKIALIKVNVEDAEFWDNAGVNGIRYAFEAVKAVIMGESPEPVAGLHDRVQPALAAR